MQRIYYHTKSRPYVIAAQWEELTPKQYIKIAALLHSKVSADEMLLRALRILLNKSTVGFKLMNKDIVARMLDHITWIFEKQECTKNLLPKYKNFYGPADDFDNLTLAEFHHCEMAYAQIVNDQDEDALTRLISFLYRIERFDYDAKKHSDRRSPFNIQLCMFYENDVAAWEKAMKQAVLMWYDACRQMLVKMYPAAFGAKKKNDNYFETFGLYNVIRNLAGTKYGTFAEVEDMFVHTAFMEIVSSVKENEELERKMKTT
jgi:hypothetical protein